MDCSKEVAKRIYSSGITFLLVLGAGGGSQVLMACLKSLVSWSPSRGGLIHLVRFFVMFNNYQKAHTGVWSLKLIHSHYHMRNPVLNYRTGEPSYSQSFTYYFKMFYRSWQKRGGTIQFWSWQAWFSI